MKIAVTLAALIVTAFSTYVLTPAAPPPLAVKAVKTETIHVAQIDTVSFRLRWEPVADMPPTTVIAAPVALAQTPERGAQPRASVKSRAVRLTVCARHGLRKVSFKRRGHSYWRCRR